MKCDRSDLASEMQLICVSIFSICTILRLKTEQKLESPKISCSSMTKVLTLEMQPILLLLHKL